MSWFQCHKIYSQRAWLCKTASGELNTGFADPISTQRAISKPQEP
jgi:hypothetical protein